MSSLALERSGLPVGHSSASAFTATAAFLVYALLVPLAMGAQAADAQSSWASALYVLVPLSVYSGSRIAYELAHGASRWFVLAFHSFVYVFFGVAPLSQIGARTMNWAINPTADTVFAASVLCLVGVLAFDGGLAFGPSLARATASLQSRVAGRSGHGGSPTRQDSQRNSTVPSGHRALWLMLALTLVSVLLLWAQGGIGPALASREQLGVAICPRASSGDLSSCGILSAGIMVPPVLLTLLALGLGTRERGFLGRLSLVVGVAALFLTANPVSAARFWFGAVVIGLLGATVGRSLRPRLLMWLAIPALLILVFPSLDFGRSEGWTSGFSIKPEAMVEKQDFDAFQQVVNGVTYVDSFGTQGGRQISSALLFFVPHVTWADKAPPTGTLVVGSLGETGNTNVSSPLWEEGYVDFGIFGAVLLLGCTGLLVGFVDASLKLSVSPSALGSTFVPFFAGYEVFVLRGSLLPAIGPLVFALGLVWAVRRLSVARAP